MKRKLFKGLIQMYHTSIWVPVALLVIIIASLVGGWQLWRILEVVREIFQMKKEEIQKAFKLFFKIPLEWKIEECVGEVQDLVTALMKQLAGECQRHIARQNELIQFQAQNCDIPEEAFEKVLSMIAESGKKFLEAHDIVFKSCGHLKGFRLSRSYVSYLGTYKERIIPLAKDHQ